MKTYFVHIYEPTIYEVEAESEKEAENKAVVLYKKEKNTWLVPDKIDVAERPTE